MKIRKAEGFKTLFAEILESYKPDFFKVEIVGGGGRSETGSGVNVVSLKIGWINDFSEKKLRRIHSEIDKKYNPKSSSIGLATGLDYQPAENEFTLTFEWRIVS